MFNEEAYHKQYVKENYITVTLRLHKQKDDDIIHKLMDKKSKNAYIKNLIRNDYNVYY